MESYIPPLCSPCGALVSDPAVKAELLSAWFDSKQSRDIVELPQTCQRIGLAYSQRSLIGACLQLSADFDYTSSVKDFRKVDLFAFWWLFGEIWGPVISPLLIQEEFGYLWCSSGHRLCWSDGIGQGWRNSACPDLFQSCLWQG